MIKGNRDESVIGCSIDVVSIWVDKINRKVFLFFLYDGWMIRGEYWRNVSCVGESFFIFFI